MTRRPLKTLQTTLFARVVEMNDLPTHWMASRAGTWRQGLGTARGPAITPKKRKLPRHTPWT